MLHTSQTRLIFVRNTVRVAASAFLLWLSAVVGFTLGHYLIQLSGALLIRFAPELFGFSARPTFAEPFILLAACSCGMAASYGAFCWCRARLRWEKTC